MTDCCNPIVLGLGQTGGGAGAPGPPGPAGAGYMATSTTSLAIASSGSKSFATQAGLAYTVGARIRATSRAGGDYMEGVVTSYSGTTLVATMDRSSGSGTHTDWDINLAGDVGATGPAAAVPTGTGFVHITAGAQDAAAQLVSNADVASGAAIAFAKLATMADQTVLGNVTGGAAVPVALTQTDLRALLAYAAIAVSGSASDLSAGTVPLARLAGITASQLSASAGIALTQLAAQADATILGNNSGSSGVPLALTATQVKTLLALAAVASSGSASDLSTGTLPGARMPALTGDVTSSANSVATTVAAVNLGTATLTGTVPLANTAALTGDVTKTAGNNATVVAAVNLGTATLTSTLPAANSPALTGNVTKTAGSNNTVIAAGVVTEAMQLLADNTTANASTSAHGYLKKLSNVATEFMNGVGNYATPADANQSANLVKAGPASGAAAAPTYRALVQADTPGYPVGLRTEWYEFDHFIGNGTTASSMSKMGWATNTSGTGANIGHFAFGIEDANRPGICYMQTGTDTTGRGGFFLSVQDTVLGGGTTMMEWWIKTPALSDATDTYTFRCGGMDTTNASDAVDGVYFEYIHSTSANWQMCCASNSTRTKTASSTAYAATTWVRLKWIANAAGTSVEFFVDDVSIGTVSTNIPTGNARQFGPSIVIIKSAGTTSRVVHADLWAIYQAFTTPV